MAKNVRTALVGSILFIPGAVVFSMLVLGMEPNFGPLAPSGPGTPHLVQSLVVLCLIVILPGIALALNLVPLMRARRAGMALLAHPMNLAVSVAALGIISLFLGDIIVDQYPCWIGVPNCD